MLRGSTWSHWARKGRGPEGGRGRVQGRGSSGIWGACLGHQEPQAPVPGLPGTSCDPPPSVSRPSNFRGPRVGGLGLLSRGLTRRTHPPTVSGKISWPSCPLPTEESRLLRPVCVPTSQGAGALVGYLWPWAAEWLKQFISSWREEAMPLASSMLRRGSAPRLSNKLTSS